MIFDKIFKLILIKILIVNAANKKVVKNDICEKIESQGICGPLSECISNKKDPIFLEIGPYCVCQTNTYGKPPNCIQKCTSDESCKEDEYCSSKSGKCEKGCRNHLNCTHTEACNRDTGRCEKGCLVDEHCKLNEHCSFDYICKKICQSDEDCKKSEYCVEYPKECREKNKNELITEESKCISDDNCDINEFCDNVDKKCKIGCRNHESCNVDEYCGKYTRKCLKGCRSDESCKTNEYCSHKHKCKNGNRFIFCEENEIPDYISRKCIPRKCQYDGNCKNNEYCDYRARKCKIGCRDSDSCKENEYCEENSAECIQGCRDDKNCQKDEYCSNEHTCEIGCRNHQSCKENFICDYESRKCIRGCRGDENCQEEEYCSGEHKCEIGCRNDDNCDDKQYCDNQNICSDFSQESYCGENSKVVVLNHRKYCQCIDGFIARPGGCQLYNGTKPVFQPNDPILCFHFCGDGSECELIDDDVACTCKNNNEFNPFEFCGHFLPPASRPPQCECCKSKIKPNCPYPIDPNLLKTLLG